MTSYFTRILQVLLRKTPAVTADRVASASGINELTEQQLGAVAGGPQISNHPPN